MIVLPSFHRRDKSGVGGRDTSHPMKQRQQWFQEAALVWSQRMDRTDPVRWNRDFLLYKEIVLEVKGTPPVGLAFDFLSLWRQGFQFVPRHITAHERVWERSFLRLHNEVYHRLLRSSFFQRLHHLWLSLDTLSSSPEVSRSSDEPKDHHPQTFSLAEKALIYLTAQLFRPVSALLLESFRPHPLFSSSPTMSLRSPVFVPTPTEGAESLQPLWVVDPLGCVSRFEEDIQCPRWLETYHDAWIDAWLSLDFAEWLPVSMEPILQHIEHLHTPLQRLQWQQLHTTLTQIPPVPHLHTWVELRELGYQSWNVPTSSHRPEGGYVGLSRRGELESLLPSEWLFWDDLSRPNPFWARWFEQECLFYEREQSHSHTRHRRIVFDLDLDPGEIRYKPSNLSVSGYTIVLALLARICQDLRHICPAEVLSFSFRLGPAVSWVSEVDVFALFFESLPNVGANTQFVVHAPSTSTIPIPATTAGLFSQPRRIQTSPSLRVYVATPSRWQQNQSGFDMAWVVGPDVSASLCLSASSPCPVVSLSLEQIDSSWRPLTDIQHRVLEWILTMPLSEGFL